MDMKKDVANAGKTRTMWRKKLDPAKVAEYIERHEEIWPEMIDLIKSTGTRNFSIFVDDNEAFAYLENDNLLSPAELSEKQKEIEVKWQASMRPLSADKVSEDQGLRTLSQFVFFVE